MDDWGSPLLRRLLDAHGSVLRATHAHFGDATATLEASALCEVMTFLRDQPGLQFDMLTDLTAVDYLGEKDRFEMVYHLYSVALNHRLRIKARLPESQPVVASLTGLWASADWMEREVFDLYGIRFEGHPDLRRILLYDEFVGHPLRKDYAKTARQPLLGPRGA